MPQKGVKAKNRIAFQDSNHDIIIIILTTKYKKKYNNMRKKMLHPHFDRNCILFNNHLKIPFVNNLHEQERKKNFYVRK